MYRLFYSGALLGCPCFWESIVTFDSWDTTVSDTLGDVTRTLFVKDPSLAQRGLGNHDLVIRVRYEASADPSFVRTCGVVGVVVV
jgi:hypothetical protein